LKIRIEAGRGAFIGSIAAAGTVLPGPPMSTVEAPDLRVSFRNAPRHVADIHTRR